jgi:hypothetical protein
MNAFQRWPGSLNTLLVMLLATASAVGQPPRSEITEEGQVAEVNSLTLPMFTAKVQPVLMNLCVRCHSQNNRDRQFRLVRINEGFADIQGTTKNIQAVARYLNPQQPSNSILLQKALQSHGGLREPLVHSRAHPAYRNLEYWVSWAVSPEGSQQPVIRLGDGVVEDRVETSGRLGITSESVPGSGVNPQSNRNSTDSPVATVSSVATVQKSGGILSAGAVTPVLVGPAVGGANPDSPGTTGAEPAPVKPGLIRWNPNDPFDPAVFNSLGR